ncbi:MAG: hypothetical protein Q8Q09_10175 [Deltaproteobacteria bacterium]|nr:hypothetical protein [Deltaproteobacteria bacterium]
MTHDADAESGPQGHLEVVDAGAVPAGVRAGQEAVHASEGAAESAPESALEVTGDALASALGQADVAQGQARRKPAASAWAKRESPQQSGMVDRQVGLLVGEAPLLAVLWPDLSAQELLEGAKPSPELFARRFGELQSSIDLFARRGYEQRNQAAVAQRALDRRRAVLAQSVSLPSDAANELLCDAAVSELSAHRDQAFVAWALALAGAARSLFANDLSRVDEEAAKRGLARDRARALLDGAGVRLHDTRARAWSACHGLPNAPSSLDAAGLALLEHPTHGYSAIKRGDVGEWLRANEAPVAITEVADEVRRLSEGTASEAHVVHTMAWLFGRTEIRAGHKLVRSPSELGPAVRAGEVSLDDLARGAREKSLGAWLRRAGWSAAAAAADALGRGEALGIERLAWSLGEPLRVGELAFNDPLTLGKTVLDARATAALRSELQQCFTRGELLAWLESLPTSQRDEWWIERLKRAKERGFSDTRALWAGIYRAAGPGTALRVQSEQGASVELTSLRQLTATLELVGLWDGLKAHYRSGELLAWITVTSPEHDLVEQERLEDEDSAVNELLWELGHTGLVIEWGREDLALTSLEDIVRAYRRDWRWFESQLRRGYVLRWIERFYGKRLCGGVELGLLVERLRGEMAGLPAGMAALKCALLCGLRQLPLDPCEPGDAATVVGYLGVSGRAGREADWEALRSHMTWGAGHLWVAQLPEVKASTLPLLMRSAFAASPSDHRDAPDRLFRALAMSLGSPVLSPALAARMGQLTLVPTAPTAPTAAPTVAPTPESAPQTPPTTEPVNPFAPPPAKRARGSKGVFVVSVLALGAMVGAAVYYRAFLQGVYKWLVASRSGQRVPVSPTALTGCVLTGARFDLGRGALAERGLHAVSQRGAVSVAWVTLAESLGGARIAPNGTIERQADTDALSSIGREQTRTIHRAYAVATAVGAPLRVTADQLVTGDTRREVVACGARAWPQQLPATRGTSRAQRERAVRDPWQAITAGTAALDSTFFCRTAGTEAPFVISARGEVTPRGALDKAQIWVSDDGERNARSLGNWPVDIARVGRGPEVMAALRDEGPSSAEGDRRGTLQGVTVARLDRMYAWLWDTTSRTVDAVMLSHNGAPGPARMALGNAEAVIAWVDQAPPQRALFLARLGLDRRNTVQRVEPLGRTVDDPVAPSVVSLVDGGWLLAWAQRAGTSRVRSAWVQRYDRALRSQAAPLEVLPGVSVLTARLAYDNLGAFTVVYVVDDAAKTVGAVQGRCP